MEFRLLWLFVNTKKRYPDTDWLFEVATHLWFSRLTFFSATKLSRLMVAPGLRKRASSPKIEWRSTRCLVERGRGWGRATARETAQVCLQNAVDNFAFLAPFTQIRLPSPPVVSKTAIRQMCCEPERRQARFRRVSTARSGAVFSVALSSHVRWFQISYIYVCGGTVTKLLFSVYACCAAL